MLTPNQLKQARAERWRQAANPLLTLEEAGVWLHDLGLVLLLPRPAAVPAPAPSLAEAMLGHADATASPETIEQARRMAERLIAEGAAVPVNLFRQVSSQPDMLATPEAFGFLYALTGDRNWKKGPQGRSSPLSVETWKLLAREGALTAGELQSRLGRALTEAAVLRTLDELWHTLRVLPVYSGEPSAAAGVVHWEPLERQHLAEIHAGTGMAQATALSALISLYLRAAVAAPEEEIAAFLSPFAARSRVREAVRGMAATRLLTLVPVGTESYVHLAGELPEFAETAASEETRAPNEDRAGAGAGAGSPGGYRAKSTTGEGRSRSDPERGTGPGSQRGTGPGSGRGAERKPWHARRPQVDQPGRTDGGLRTPRRSSSPDKFPERAAGGRDGRPRPAEQGGSYARPSMRPAGPRESAEDRPRPTDGGYARRPGAGSRSGPGGRPDSFRSSEGRRYVGDRPGRAASDRAGSFQKRPGGQGFAGSRSNRPGGPAFFARSEAGRDGRPGGEERRGSGAQAGRGPDGYQPRSGSLDTGTQAGPKGEFKPRFSPGASSKFRPASKPNYGSGQGRGRGSGAPPAAGAAGEKDFERRPRRGSSPGGKSGPRFGTRDGNSFGTRFGGRSGPQPGTKGEWRPGPKSGPKSSPMSGFKSGPGSGPKSGPKSKPKPSSKFDSKLGAKSGFKSGSAFGPRWKSGPKPDGRPSGRPGPKSAPRPGGSFRKGSRPGGRGKSAR